MELHSFGHWLRLKRKALDLTREGLADRVGYSAETIRKIEAEERRPSAQLVDQLAALFEIPENQRGDFLRFARGDWQAAPAGNVESPPWLVTRSRQQDDPLKSKIHLATFLFTDIEGSSKLWEHEPQKMKVALQRHHEILQEAIASNDGEVFQIVGNAFSAVFPTVLSALSAAMTAQQELHREQWDLPFPIRVRMGIHTGEAERKLDSDYASNPTLNRVACILAAGHGGQVLLSLVTKDLVKDSLPANTELRDMGEHSLKNLMYPEHLFQLTSAGLPSDFPPLNTLTHRHNLPAQLTTFIGREDEIAEIKKDLESHRLVTLTGPGGIGKTRLSVQVAMQLLETIPDGVWFVELAPLTDPDLIPQTIHTTLGLVELPGKNIQQVLIDYLREKKTLLILDNCEHLVEACAQLIHTLLRHSPSLKILASSREALGVEGELAWHVPSLSLPDLKNIPELDQLTQYEAVHLFLDRASLANPRFLMTEDHAPAIAQICYRLDGIPLATELAAARLRGLSVEQIASRLDDRFHLLTSGARTVLPRHQTLHALIDWSHDLLSQSERALLRRLSVFAGGWTLEAAESVCAGDGLESDEILDVLLHLVDKSLVVAETQGIEPRYHMLETIRQYAGEKLWAAGEGERLRQRHMEYFCRLVEQIEPVLRGPNQNVLLDGLERELNNHRAALEWSLDHDVSAGLRLASGLNWFWHLRHRWTEGVDWLDKLLRLEAETHSIRSDSGSDPFYRAKALIAFSRVTGSLGDLQRAMASTAESLALCEQMDRMDCTPLIAENYLLLGIGAFYAGDIEQAKILAEKSRELFLSCGDKFGVAEVQGNLLVVIALRSGELEAARLLSESTLAIREELGDWDGRSSELDNGGLIALAQGDYDRAQTLFRDNIEASRLMRNDSGLQNSLGNLGITHLFKGEMDLAREYFLQVAKFAQEKWDPIFKTSSVYWLAMYSFEQKQFRKVIRLNSFLEKETAHHMYLFFAPAIITTTFERNVAVARAELGEESLHQAESEGKAMTLDQALGHALEGIDEHLRAGTQAVKRL